jgi:hypothetical protein
MVKNIATASWKSPIGDAPALTARTTRSKYSGNSQMGLQLE